MDEAAQTESSNETDSLQCGIGELPVELLDLVLESVREDRVTILACSWVSRLWHEVALPYLFASLKIASKYDFVDFHGFLQMHPHIACRVRKLQLKVAYTEWTDRMRRQDDYPVVGRAQLIALVALLPRLQELHLYDLWLIDSPNPASDAPNPLPTRTLEKLTVERCSAPGLATTLSLVTVLNIISVFDSIDTLELLAMQISSGTTKRARHIRTLNVAALITGDLSTHGSRFAASALYDPLRASLAPGCLRSLELECIGAPLVHVSAVLPSFGALVASAARNALHIHIPFQVSLPQIGPNGDSPEHWRALNLQACTSLRSLTLDVLVPRSNVCPPEGWIDTPDASVAQVCRALLANVPMTIRVLTLKFWRLDTRWGTEFDNATSLGLRALDAALAARHEYLKRLEVMISICVDEEGTSLALLTAMPELRAKGMLRVVEWRGRALATYATRLFPELSMKNETRGSDPRDPEKY
ncbi:uncharacterized protein TRAVEDRAFT_51443 [Trametes versicolor FP-101664 SS1]|uniref:uncharacterized protein n=1 Tax=Trametes versicolor (strain FP-101664) TaxID=717944 RepID=UPI000462214D|nr:uncharacterized protein TRAVEDRAFT_51443 [Trametes versicolor FP-101664 SS1]EIW55320.1 hypothetical protein TRAVEDRAFT_51443 [Trametes versicolor FP-101664 SS1]